MKTARWTAVSMLVALLACGVASVDAATIYVGEGDSLQDALDAAQPGDTILLQQGAEFVGTFVLPAKGGDAWIVIRTSAPDTVLPPDGVRIHPAHAPLLARLRSPTLDTAALRTAPGAHHWDIRYLEFGGNPAGSADIIQLGDGSAVQNALDLVPHHIVLRHVYVHGDPLIGQKRCIALNAADVTIADSYVSDCKSTTQDSQAIGGWNGPGPYTIENNYLEAAGENVMIGGSDPSITDLVPSDIVFRRNHFSRPMAWRNPIIPTPQAVFATPEAGGSLAPGTYGYRVVARRLVGGTTIGRSTASAEVTATVTSDTGGAVHIRWDPVPEAAEYHVYGRSPGTQTVFWRVTTPEFFDSGGAGTPGATPTSAGTTWMVKNLFELKSARNVFVDSNVFENHWKADQPGWAIVLTPRNSGGACTWCVVEQVTFQYNLFANISGGINMTGYDSPPRITKQTNDIKILQNLFIMTTALGGPAYLLQMGDGPRDVKVHHNTIDSNGSTVVYVYGGTAADPREVEEFEYYANASRHGSFGLNGAFFSYALGIINGFYPGGRIEKNYLAGAPLSRYPPGTLNVVPFEAQFVDVPNGDYRVRDGSPLRGVAPPDPRFCYIPEGCTNADIGADMATLVTRIADVRPGPPDNVPGAPTALFTVTCVYLQCTFADQSMAGSAALVDRLWSFGDGTESTAASGTHTFAGAGTYRIRLTVRDAGGLSDSHVLFVSVRPPNVPPTASFTSACTDLVCRFTNTSVDSDGTIVASAWTFGSVGTSSEASPTFKFPAPGTYPVTLAVTDHDGAVSSVTSTVELRPLLHAAFVDTRITSSGSGLAAFWRVTTTVAVHGADERPIVGATMRVTWNAPLPIAVSCVSGADGLCTFDSGPMLRVLREWTTFTVLNLSAPLGTCQPGVNHDKNGTATGMSVTIFRP